MTREEAIERWVIPALKNTWNEKKCDEILKALEQEPCNDCISRQAAIKPFLVDATEEWTSADIVKYLKSLLSVMPTMIYPQVPGITPIVVPIEEEQGDIQYDDKTTLNKEDVDE